MELSGSDIPLGRASVYEVLTEVLEKVGEIGAQTVIVLCYDGKGNPLARYSNTADMASQIGLIEKSKFLMLNE
jgi:hypothetical protein